MFNRDTFSIPPAPLALTIAGLMPFIGAAGAAILLRGDAARVAEAQLALISYTAVILSFLGGVRWGTEIESQHLTPPRWGELILSVLGALIGWALILWGVLRGFSAPLLFAAAGAILLHWLWDVTSRKAVPEWYKGLRHIATAGAALSLSAAALSAAL